MFRGQKWYVFFSGMQLVLGLALWAGFYAFVPADTFTCCGRATAVVETTGRLPGCLLLFLFLLAASYLASLYRFSFGKGGYYIIFDIPFCIAALLLVSPAAAVAIAVFVTGADSLRRLRQKTYKRAIILTRFVSTAGNRMLRFGLGWMAFVAAGGDSRHFAGVENLVPLLLFIVVFFLSNNLFFLLEEYAKSEDLMLYWKEALAYDLPFTLIILILGYMLSVAAVSSGIWQALLMSVFVLMAAFVSSKWTKTRFELENRLEELTILREAGMAAASNLDVMPMVEAFTRTMSKYLPADGIAVIFCQRYSSTVYVVQVEGEKSRSTYHSGEMGFNADKLPLSEASKKLGERLYEFLQPLETAPFMIPPSVFGLPLLHGGEPFGGIVLYSYKEGVDFRRWTELLGNCSRSLVVGLENCFLHLQAIQDPLTELYNRSYFLYRLEEELSFSARHRAPFGLLMLDLDDFKAVNDHMGHATGDNVLRRIGDILRNETRREDVPARYGGDEFIVLLLGCPLESAREKAERIRERLVAKALPKEDAGGLSIGCSVGMLHSDSFRGERDVPTLLRRLDDALYQAKQSGKNKVVISE